MLKSQKTRCRIFFYVYLVLILYFMFLGFNRTLHTDTYHISLTITRIPLWFPKQFSYTSLRLWMFSLGNLILFVPFGLFLPLVFPKAFGRFPRAVLLFIVCITGLETLQLITRLGSFDVEDILVNTLGFIIGFFSLNIAKHKEKRSAQTVLFLISSTALSILCIIVSQYINRLF